MKLLGSSINELVEPMSWKVITVIIFFGFLLMFWSAKVSSWLPKHEYVRETSAKKKVD